MGTVSGGRVFRKWADRDKEEAEEWTNESRSCGHEGKSSCGGETPSSEEAQRRVSFLLDAQRLGRMHVWYLPQMLEWVVRV